MNKVAILVAGGKGTRMGAGTPKQFLELNGRPILMHTLEVFYSIDSRIELIVVLPEDQLSYWDKVVNESGFRIPHRRVIGGASRFQSVKNGLQAVSFSEGVVAIHDGVRPFVAPEVVKASFEMAEQTGSAIPVIGLKDSIRQVFPQGKSEFRDRQQYRLVQTPQTFQLSKIRQAFLTPESDQFTDDATVYEYQGWEVTLIEGNPENIKITTPEDLDYAAYLLSKKGSR